MPATAQLLTALTAGDIMTREVLQIPETMPLREAAHLLLLHQISGAPVVEAGGTCVGVISTLDLLRWANQCDQDTSADDIPHPRTCLFQIKHREPSGDVWTLCTLPDDVCPIQRKQTGADGMERNVCNEPHCVLTDWQVVEMEQLPTEAVSRFMTSDPVLVSRDTPIADLARSMVDAHIHRLIVVDGQRRPIGVVSSTDILAQVAQANANGSIHDAS